MPFFSPKTWKQRIVEFPGRRRLDDTSSADVYDVSRAEGTVTQEGDGFTAANMNDLEQRINNAVNDVAGLSTDEYDPNATYSAGDLRIHDNILYKANQAISVAEPWTPDHWDATTIAAELKAQAEDISDLNSRGIKVLDLPSTTASAEGIINTNLPYNKIPVCYIDELKHGWIFSFFLPGNSNFWSIKAVGANTGNLGNGDYYGKIYYFDSP